MLGGQTHPGHGIVQNLTIQNLPHNR
jgi:hypothetical protein